MNNFEHTDISSILPRPIVKYKVNGNPAKRIGNNIIFNQTTDNDKG
jgi:hypothetical protein